MGVIELIAGVDEVGRGSLAGPVVAAAVILDSARPIRGLADSKTLSAARRKELAAEIHLRALAVGLGRAEVEEIDQLNILQASLLAMERAVAALARVPARILVDGNRRPRGLPQSEPIVDGDARMPAISAASIVAKVTRDAELDRLDAVHPGYGLARHKGYPTAQHLAALERLGPSACHRSSFAPVRRLFAAGAESLPMIDITAPASGRPLSNLE